MPLGSCKNATCTAEFHVSANVKVPANNEPALTDAIAMQPVMVGIDASQTSFQLYSGGIYSDPHCSSTVWCFFFFFFFLFFFC